MNLKEEILPTIIREEITKNEDAREVENRVVRLYQSNYTLLEKFGKKKHIPGLACIPHEEWETPEVELKKDGHVFKISVLKEDFSKELPKEKYLSDRLLVSIIGHYDDKGKLFKSSAFLELYKNGSCLIKTGSRIDKGRFPTIEDLKNYQEFCEFLGKKLAESGEKAKGGSAGGAGSY